MGREKTLVFLRKYTMVIVLILVTLFFTWKTGGRMLLPQNVNNLIAQNAYVFILATGMLLCRYVNHGSRCKLAESGKRCSTSGSSYFRC